MFRKLSKANPYFFFFLAFFLAAIINHLLHNIKNMPKKYLNFVFFLKKYFFGAKICRRKIENHIFLAKF
jgi:hypothetical protein